MSGDPNGAGGGGAGVVARTDDDAANANAGRSLLACPKSWQLYFPDVTHDFSDRRAELARTMTNFFASTRGREFVKEVRRDGNAVTTRGRREKTGRAVGLTRRFENFSDARARQVEVHDESTASVTMDYEKLKEMTKDIPDLHAALACAPLECMACLRCAAHEATLCSEGGRAALQDAKGVPAGDTRVATNMQMTVKLINYEESKVRFAAMRSNVVGRVVSLRGTVTRVAPVKPAVTRMIFSCQSCQEKMRCTFKDGKYRPPERCATERCRAKKFVHELATVDCVDSQRVRIQEIADDGVMSEEGRVPRFMDCELRGALTDSCTPGDIVTMLGLVESDTVEGGGGGALARGRNQALSELYLNAWSCVVSRGKGESAGGEDKNEEDKENKLETLESPQSTYIPGTKRFRVSDARAKTKTDDDDVETTLAPILSKKELEFIADFSQQNGDDLVRTLVHSLCPQIFGHDLVKLGLLLCLFGGVRKSVAGCGKVPTRGSLHCLVVGDPGLGKSQMLKAVSNLAPRSIYVCGRTVSAAGLTAAVVRDPGTGAQTFEAGAIVLADRGVCCVDEFDKMPSEHQALLEAMEQQSVSVCKAGLNATLPARTSIIAAANPIQGHYNRGKTVNENLKMSAPLLSRFDLIFILLDTVDEVLDEHLSEHVIAQHSKHGQARRKQARQNLHAYYNELDADGMALHDASVAAFTQDLDDVNMYVPLKTRLRATQEIETLSHEVMRKYISYAHAYCHPRLTAEAAEILQTFYLELRSRAPAEGTPVTARQLESLVRLAEARARMELRSQVTANDAKDAVEIIKASLIDALSDQHGRLRFNRAGGKSTKRSKTKLFIETLNKRTSSSDSPYFSIGDLHALAEDLNLGIADVDGFIEGLNIAGELLKCGRLYKSASALTAETPSKRRR